MKVKKITKVKKREEIRRKANTDLVSWNNKKENATIILKQEIKNPTKMEANRKSIKVKKALRRKARKNIKVKKPQTKRAKRKTTTKTRKVKKVKNNRKPKKMLTRKAKKSTKAKIRRTTNPKNNIMAKISKAARIKKNIIRMKREMAKERMKKEAKKAKIAVN